VTQKLTGKEQMEKIFSDKKLSKVQKEEAIKKVKISQKDLLASIAESDARNSKRR